MRLVRINDDTIINTNAIVSITKDEIQEVPKSVILLSNGDVVQSNLELDILEEMLNG